MRIMVVDDEPGVREVISEFLVQQGHRVQTFGSGRAAIEHIEAGAEIDVALVDWHMPGIGGRDVVQRIRALCPRTHIIVATGQMAEVERLRTAIGDHVLQKPFSLRALARRLETLSGGGERLPA